MFTDAKKFTKRKEQCIKGVVSLRVIAPLDYITDQAFKRHFKLEWCLVLVNYADIGSIT